MQHNVRAVVFPARRGELVPSAVRLFAILFLPFPNREQQRISIPLSLFIFC